MQVRQDRANVHCTVSCAVSPTCRHSWTARLTRLGSWGSSSLGAPLAPVSPFLINFILHSWYFCHIISLGIFSSNHVLNIKYIEVDPLLLSPPPPGCYALGHQKWQEVSSNHNLVSQLCWNNTHIHIQTISPEKRQSIPVAGISLALVTDKHTSHQAFQHLSCFCVPRYFAIAHYLPR